MRGNIMLDLDGVIAATPQAILTYIECNYHLAVGMSVKEIQSPNLEECVPKLTKEMLEYMFMDPVFWKYIAAFSYAPFFTRNLDELGDIHIVTNRLWYPKLQSETVAWLKDNSIRYDKIVFCKAEAKAEYCKRNNIKVAIEDNPYNSKAIEAEGIPVVLMDWSYNRDVDTDNTCIYRATCYEEAHGIVAYLQSSQYGRVRLDDQSL